MSIKENILIILDEVLSETDQHRYKALTRIDGVIRDMIKDEIMSCASKMPLNTAERLLVCNNHVVDAIIAFKNRNNCDIMTARVCVDMFVDYFKHNQGVKGYPGKVG
jgi:hypothetical protein